MIAPRLLLVAMLLVPSIARAEDLDDTARRSSWPFARFGFTFGDRQLGSSLTFIDALSAAVGYQNRRSALYAEAAVGYQRDRGPVLRGLLTDLAVHGRRTLMRLDLDDELALVCWLDAGVGFQRTDWGDGALTRPVASIGLGGGPEVSHRGKRGGLGLELRIYGAPSVSWDKELARCTDGCAMRTDRYDFGAMLLLAFPFSLTDASPKRP